MVEPPSERFQLVVFDVAGTTVLDGDAVLDCVRAVMEPYAAVSLDEVRDVMGLSKPVAIRRLLDARGWRSDAELDRLVDDLHAAFRASMIERYRVDEAIAPAPGALRVFEALRRAGIRVALDTGFSRDILDTLLTRLGWTGVHAVDVSVTSDEVKRGRPHPDLIYRAMELSGVADPWNVVKVGDTPIDVIQGLAASCGLVVGVSHGTHTRAQLQRTGVIVIDSLTELLPWLGVEDA